MTVAYDINGFTQDDGIRITTQSETPFALGWSVRTNKIQSVMLGDLATSKGAKNSRTFPLQVMIYGSSDTELESRLGAFYNLIDQPILTLGRSIDGVRRTADVSLESVQEKPEYNSVAKTVKFTVIVTLRSVYWRDPAHTIVTLPNSLATDINLATNPSFETASGTVTVRTNLFTNPSPAINAGWEVSAGTGGVATRGWAAAGGPQGRGYVEAEWTTAPSGGTTRISLDTTLSAVASVAPNDIVAFSAFAWSSSGMQLRLQIDWFDSTGVYISSVVGANTVVGATTTTATRLTLITPAAPALASRFRAYVVPAATPVLGTKFGAGSALAEKSPTVLPYLDGNGNPNLISNSDFETNVTGWNVSGSGGTIVQSSTQAFIGTKSLKYTGGGISGGYLGAACALTLVVGVTYTLSGRVWIESTVGDGIRATANFGGITSGTTIATTVGGWQSVSVTFTALAANGSIYFVTSGNPSVTTGVFYLDAASLKLTTEDPEDDAQYVSDYTIAFSGAANASTSIKTAPGVASVNPNVAGALITSSKIRAYAGTRCARIAVGPTAGANVGAVLANALAVPAGTYTALLRVWNPSVAGFATPALFANSAGMAFTTLAITQKDQWAEARMTFTTLGGTLTMGLYQSNADTVGDKMFMDCFVLIAGVYTGPYFDGNTPAGTVMPNGSNVVFSWSAGPDASTSVATYSAKTTDLTPFAASTAPIQDGKILVPGAATPLTAFSLEDSNSGSGISWSLPSIPAGSYLSTFTPFDPMYPTSIASDTNGNIFIVSGSTIWQYSPSGVGMYSYSYSGYNISGIRCDNGILYAAMWSSAGALPRQINKWNIATGAALTAIPVAGTATNPLGGVAIDPTGNLYVPDPLAGLVRKISAAGVAGITMTSPSARYVGHYGGQIYVIGQSGICNRFSTTGTVLSTFAVPVGAQSAEFDSTGAFYTNVSSTQKIYKYTNAGVLVNSWGSSGSGVGQMTWPVDITLDPFGSLYTVNANPDRRVQKFDVDGIFNGVGAGKWLLIDVAKRKASLVSIASFDAAGDNLGGLSTVAWKGRRFTLSPAPVAGNLFGTSSCMVKVSQTGGGTPQFRAQGAFL